MTNRLSVLVAVVSLAAVTAPLGTLISGAGAASQPVQFEQDDRALGITERHKGNGIKP